MTDFEKVQILEKENLALKDKLAHLSEQMAQMDEALAQMREATDAAVDAQSDTRLLCKNYIVLKKDINAPV